MQEDIFKKFNKIKSYNLITEYKKQSLFNSRLQGRTKKIMHVHQRTPRTPESYFNVPESIALLNIVKSERIQCAFQSNRKNHASVWEMVAGILNKYSNRKRSAKQCCNRYENLKKIYTQLKKNPERHVRRNWPYMYLFREIEEQRGETWGITNKRAATNLLQSALNGEGLEPIEIPDLRDVNTSGNGLHQDHIIANHQHHLSNQTHPSTVTNQSAVASAIVSNVQSSSNSSSLVASIAAAAAAAAAAAGNSSTIHTNSHGNNKIKHEISYYQRRKNMVALTNMLMNREVMLTNLNNNSENSESDRLLPNNFVETELHEDDEDDDIDDTDNIDNQNDSIMVSDNCNDVTQSKNNNNINNDLSINNNHGSIDLSMFGLRAVHHNNDHNTQSKNDSRHNNINNHNINYNNSNNCSSNNNNNNNSNIANNHNKKRNIQEFGLPDFLSNIKHPEYFMNGLNGHRKNSIINNSDSNNNSNNNNIDNHNNLNNNSLTNNIINSNDITFDPNNDTLSESSNISLTTRNNKRRKSSTTETDGGESTNYELIEYLRRREKRDEDMYKKMNDREERLINLLERTVIAFERIAAAASTNIASQQKQHQQQQLFGLKENQQLFIKPINANQSCKKTNNIDHTDLNAVNSNNNTNSAIENINNDNNNSNNNEIMSNNENSVNNDNNRNNNDNNNTNLKSINNSSNKNNSNIITGNNNNSSIETIKILNVASVNKKSIESSLSSTS
ncbi:putative uncharacterized protein DDB_G0286901 isoform X2 [Condylostylus longicornis]|uniref:putative uncharacterized protein DDB_G0286901 isoform X2 n=1 Tax=Condylostylus longicornis TaxID=2530218 RepID=UPI00244DC6EE|nr:putative uncharacterized protein DDB_G0286901 isoform X2 [Condylostylus longicornis]